MNRQAIIFMGIVVLAAALMSLGWWIFPRKFKSELVPARHAETAKNDGGATPSTWEDEQRGKQKERAKTIFQAIEKTNVPINFWGKVIDQNGQSVGDVKVAYAYSIEHGNMLGVAWGEQEMQKGEVVTNGAGLFSIAGLRGHVLSIESFRKEGYQYSRRGAMVYNFYGDTPAGKFTPDASNPVIFTMVNKATAEPLVSYGGLFGKTMRLPGDGTPVRWNLWKGYPDANGELQITFKREPAILAQVGPPTMWSAKIEVIGGGIVEAKVDESIRQAPEYGYASISDYPKVEQKQGVPARSFYIRTADKKYGRLQLEIYPGDEGPTTRCLIKVSMNPSGSRILESK